MRYDQYSETGFSPPIDPKSTTQKPNYQVVFDHDETSNLFRILLPGYADNGTYFIVVENNNDAPIHCQVNVVSYPRTPGSEPVTLTPTILEKQMSEMAGQTIVIYAALAQGEYPILFADVWAEITRPLAEGITDTVNITLKDDGIAADIIKDDGIYSGSFFQFSNKGRYSIKVLANGNNGKAAVSKGHMLGVGKMDEESYDILG